jgi:uncharacterized protein
VIVADTGAILALIDADDRHHSILLDLYERNPDAWLLPWAILPEVDYLLRRRVDAEAGRLFLRDVASAAFPVEWGTTSDLARARELDERYADLGLGLVDAAVMAVAERVGAEVIATLDERHFGAVEQKNAPALWPRDALG